MKLGDWLFLIVPLVGVVELVAHAVERARTPSNGDYEQLAEVVPTLARPTEPIVVAPRWAEPHVRRALGPGFFPLRALARSGVETWGHATEISLRGARAPELSAFVEEGRAEVGPFVVRSMQNPRPESTTYDFVDHVEPGALTVERQGDAEGEGSGRCGFSRHATVLTGGLAGHPTFPRERFVCGPGGFFDVGVTVIADQDFLPRRCIFAHPSRTGDLVLRFARVPLGSRIVGHGGMYWVIERTRDGAPVELELRVDGDLIGSTWHADGDGFAPFSFALGRHAGAEVAEVELRVRSPNYLHRHFCFEASSR